jgi:predicted molibdopterin-dependent oxidoreductase YjgC
VVEIMDAAYAGKIRGMYIMGENPAMSDPDVDHARAAMAKLDHLVVQDIFLTETAYLADVVLPATAWPEKDGTVTNTDRMVQLGRKALQPPGEAKEDLWIIVQLAKRLGLDWSYAHPKEVFDEMRQCMDTGAMTRRSGVLDAIEPGPTASLHPLDLDRLKVRPGELLTVESRRGRITLHARADAGTPRGAVFIPFCYYEAAANLLTNPALDPFGKIPEFKYCAVKVSKGGTAPGDPGYGKGRTLEEFNK